MSLTPSPAASLSVTVLSRPVLATALAMLSLGGCSESLPTAPSQLTTGIVVYEHANFLGESAHIARDISDLSFVRGPCVESVTANNYTWNDCISSVRVAPGWRATLYRDDEYRDDSLVIVADVPNLALVAHDCPHGGLNDCVTSVRVRSQ